MAIGTLGPRYQKQLEALVHEHLVNIHDKNCDTRAQSDWFLKVHERIYQQCWSHIKYYEQFCTEYRRRPRTDTITGKTYRLQPFCWSMETPESARACFRTKNGKPQVPSTPEQRHKIEQRKRLKPVKTDTKTMTVRELAAIMQIKPEYQGKNHPLQRNQANRQEKAL